MPQLTPALPPRYRRRALVALRGLMTGARGDVSDHLATVERMAAAGEETTAARAGLVQSSPWPLSRTARSTRPRPLARLAGRGGGRSGPLPLSQDSRDRHP